MSKKYKFKIIIFLYTIIIFSLKYAKAKNINKIINNSNSTNKDIFYSIKQNINKLEETSKELNYYFRSRVKSISSKDEYILNFYNLINVRKKTTSLNGYLFPPYPFSNREKAQKSTERRINELLDIDINYYENCSNTTKKIIQNIKNIEDILYNLEEDINKKIIKKMELAKDIDFMEKQKIELLKNYKNENINIFEKENTYDDSLVITNTTIFNNSNPSSNTNYQNISKNLALVNIINDANKILYTVNKNLNLGLFNEIDNNNLLVDSLNINNFRFSFNNEIINRKSSLNFKSNITRFTVAKDIDFNNFGNFGFILSYNDIDTKDHKIKTENKEINLDLDSKGISAGVHLKYFIIDNSNSNLFTNIKLIYSYSRNKQNYFINDSSINYYNSGKFNSHQVALQTGLGSDLLTSQFFKLSTRIDINTIFLNIGKRNLNIDDIKQKFDTKSDTFVSLTPSIFLVTNQLYITNNAKLNFGLNLSYNKALSETKINIDNKDKSIDNDIIGFAIATNLSLFDNINLGLNYNLSKTKSVKADNSFGINLNSNF